MTFKKCKDGYENTTFDTAFFIESFGFVCFFLSFPFNLKVKVAQLCLSLCDPMDYIIPDMSTNVTYFSKHMNKMTGAMNTPEASVASLWEMLTSSL